MGMGMLGDDGVGVLGVFVLDVSLWGGGMVMGMLGDDGVEVLSVFVLDVSSRGEE